MRLAVGSTPWLVADDSGAEREAMSRQRSTRSWIGLIIMAIALAAHALVADGPFLILLLDTALAVFLASCAGVVWIRGREKQRSSEPTNVPQEET